MVLEHVAHRAGFLVEGGAALDPDRLGHGDLHVVDELPVPDRLEDAVRKPKRQHVLHGLLAQIVVDPKDLPLDEVPGELVVQLASALAIVAEGLLDDQARPAAGQSALVAPDLLHQHGQGARRHRQVVDTVSFGAAIGGDLTHPLRQPRAGVRLAEVGREVEQPLLHSGPGVRIQPVPPEPLDRFPHLRAEALVRALGAGDPENGELLQEGVA